MSESTERWMQMQTLFERHVDESSVARARSLDQECDSDPELRATVQRLLDADVGSGEFIHSAIANAAADMEIELQPTAIGEAAA